MSDQNMRNTRKLILLLVALALGATGYASGETAVAEAKVGRTAGTTGSTYGPFEYDPSGNIISIGGDATARSEYRYDALGRLVWAATERSGNSHTQTYQFDVYGNRISATTATVTTTYSVDGGTNRLGVGAPHHAQYDQAGNLREWIPPQQAATRTYAYDALNMMVKEAAPVAGGVKTTHHIYTASDERYWEFHTRPDPVVSGSTINTGQYTIRDLGGRVLRQYREEPCAPPPCTGTVFSVGHDYIYRGSALLADAAPASAHHYSLDHLGTPRIVTNQTGEQIGRHTYHPFGVEITDQAPSEGPLKFTGHERDADLLGSVTGALDYMHARYYSANLGRFLSVDPYLDLSKATRHPQNWNRYSYVRNNPINLVDPDGRDDVNIGGDWDEPGAPNPAKDTAFRKEVTDRVLGGISLAIATVFLDGGPEMGDGERPKADRPYQRPSGATTPQQRQSVQGQPCEVCGNDDGGKRVAGHKKALVQEHYQTGTINKQKMRSVDAVRPECPTCSAKEGAAMSRYSRAMKTVLKEFLKKVL